MRGDMRFESKEGVGSTFFFTIVVEKDPNYNSRGIIPFPSFLASASEGDSGSPTNNSSTIDSISNNNHNNNNNVDNYYKAISSGEEWEQKTRESVAAIVCKSQNFARAIRDR